MNVINNDWLYIGYSKNKPIMPFTQLLSMLFAENRKACIQEEVLFHQYTSTSSVHPVEEKYNELLRIINKQIEEPLAFSERVFLTKNYKSYQNEINGLSLRRLSKTSRELSK